MILVFLEERTAKVGLLHIVVEVDVGSSLMQKLAGYKICY